MSETTNLKLLKHDNVETNTDKFDIENYLNGNWDKIDENVGEVNTNISNIKKEQEAQNTNIEENNSKIVELQTEKAKLETELKEMQEDFYQNSIRGQVSGEYIHVEDSSGARCKIGISGNSEQETSTQGKNYFTGNKIAGGSNFGVNYSFDNSILKLNGTATNSENIILDKPTKVKIPAGTYTYTIKVKSGTFERPSGDFAVYIMSASNTFIAGDYTNSSITGFELTQKKGTVSHMFNLTEEKEIYLRCYTSKANIVFNNLELEIQIESGSVYTEFEQFVPNMPSPDYPSEIKTVGSNVNLFNKDNYIKSKLYINKNENKFSEASMGKSFIFDISKYNKLTISKVSSERFGVFASVDYPQKDGVGTYLQDVATKTTSFTYDFTEFNYLVVMYYLTSDTITEQQILDSIKIVEGTEVGEYSKFGQGCVKVTKCNKNLFDKNTTTDGKYIGGNGSVQTQSNIMHSDYIQIKTNINYYITGRSDLSKVALYDKNKTFLEITSTTQPNGVLNITNSNCKYIIINALLTNKDTLQIEEKTATAYEEHQEQSYIIPIQSEMLEGDYFDWDNEEEVHTWNKLVLDGTEDGWLKREVASEECRFEFHLSVVALNNNQTINILCDKLKGLTADATYLKQEGISASTWVQIYLKEFSQNKTVEDFKNWLKEHPLTIYYKLATPERLKFTNEQKAVAKELNNARTYKNVTNITTDSKAILSLDYAKDLETQNQKMQNEIDEIKQLLSTTQTSAMLLDNLQKEVESEVE